MSQELIKEIFQNQTLRGEKKLNNNPKEKEKGSSKNKKVEGFNYGGLWHMVADCPSPKRLQMQIL